jgi:hypothetical protein
MKVTLTEKCIALFRRVGQKGDREVDWDAEIAELEDDMLSGLCPQCCFAECQCQSPKTGKAT